MKDGTGTKAISGTVYIDVVPVNDAPVLAGIEIAALPYVENAAATQISNAVTASDIDSATLASATVTITNFQTVMFYQLQVFWVASRHPTTEPVCLLCQCDLCCKLSSQLASRKVPQHK